MAASCYNWAKRYDIPNLTPEFLSRPGAYERLGRAGISRMARTKEYVCVIRPAPAPVPVGTLRNWLRGSSGVIYKYKHELVGKGDGLFCETLGSESNRIRHMDRVAVAP